jgi:hypothetical protein
MQRLLIPWCMILLKNLTVALIVNKLSLFMEPAVSLLCSQGHNLSQMNQLRILVLFSFRYTVLATMSRSTEYVLTI